MRWLSFCSCHIIAAFLLGSWLFPPTRALWNAADTGFFLLLNSNLEGHPFWQVFWALSNVRLTDLVGALFMSTFLVLWVREGEKCERPRRWCQMAYICLWSELGILFTKKIVEATLQHFHFMRESPTIMHANSILLSAAVPWLKVKDFSYFSFPGNHAEILFQWAAFTWVICGRRYGFMALFAAICFSLPRLVGGAHWLSDAIVGSLSIVLVMVACALYTPLYRFWIEGTAKLLNAWKPKEPVCTTP